MGEPGLICLRYRLCLLERSYPPAIIRTFGLMGYPDNAKYHHARIVQNWLARDGCRVTLHFVPAYCPHLAPIERLWGLMHRNVTHNKCYKKFNVFCEAIPKFLTEDVPKNWHIYCDKVTDNFRVIDPQNFPVLKEK